MTRKKRNEKFEQDAAEILKAMPEARHIALALCVHGFGMDWEQVPREMRDVFINSARRSRYAASAALAMNPELMKQSR